MSLESPPRTWSETSLEFKILFFGHIILIVLMMIEADVLTTLGVVGAEFALIALTSIWRKQRHGWRWQRPSALGWFFALVTAAAGALFLFVGSGLIAGSLSAPMPWIGAGFAIVFFMILVQLNILHLSETAFRAACGEGEMPVVPPQPRWKRVVVGIFGVIFFAVWLQALSTFGTYQIMVNHAELAPTIEKSVPFNIRGKTIYVSARERERYDAMLSIMMIAIPSTLAVAFLLNFGLGIRLDGRQN